MIINAIKLEDGTLVGVEFDGEFLYINGLQIQLKDIQEICDKFINESLIDPEMSIADLDIPTRAYTALMRSRIYRVRELLKLSASDVMNMPSMGKKSFDELVQCLSDNNLHLKK